MKSAVRASLVAPLTAPLLYYAIALVQALLDPVRRGSIGESFTSGVAVILAVGAPIAYAATGLVGLPALWFVGRFGPLTMLRTVIVGLAAGVAVAILMAPWLRGELFSIPLAPWEGGALG